MCWATIHEIPLPDASLGEPPGELAGQHAQAVVSRRYGLLAHGSEAIAPAERVRSIAELLGWESACPGYVRSTFHTGPWQVARNSPERLQCVRDRELEGRRRPSPLQRRR